MKLKEMKKLRENKVMQLKGVFLILKILRVQIDLKGKFFSLLYYYELREVEDFQSYLI